MQKREIDYDNLLIELGFNEDEYELVYPPDEDIDRPVKLDNLIKEEKVIEEKKSNIDKSQQKQTENHYEFDQKAKNRIESNIRISKEKYGGFKKPKRPPINKKPEKTISAKNKISSTENVSKKKNNKIEDHSQDMIFKGGGIRKSIDKKSFESIDEEVNNSDYMPNSQKNSEIDFTNPQDISKHLNGSDANVSSQNSRESNKENKRNNKIRPKPQFDAYAIIKDDIFVDKECTFIYCKNFLSSIIKKKQDSALVVRRNSKRGKAGSLDK